MTEDLDQIWDDYTRLLRDAGERQPDRCGTWTTDCADNAAAQAKIWARLQMAADHPAWRFAAHRIAAQLRHNAELLQAAKTSPH